MPWATPRGIVYGAMLLAMVVCVPTLFAGFFVDDYVHILSIEGRVPGTGPFDLFNFAPGDPQKLREYMGQVPYPWFTLPDIHIHFFRPLSSALMALDHALFGREAFWYHVHSMLWYVLFAGLVALLYRRLFDPSLALLCALLFVLDDGHAIPAGWWSNRNALVAAVPAVLALLAHLRWRESGQGRYLAASVAALVLGILGGEGAIGICGYLLAYEWLARRETVLNRALVPAALVVFIFLLLYHFFGYGVYGSGIYFDPMRETWDFLRHAPERAVMFAGAQFLSLPVEIPVVHAAALPLLATAGGATLLFIAWLLRLVWPTLAKEEQRQVRWLLLGSAISAVPVLATFASGRLLLIPSIGCTAAIACILRAYWRRVVPSRTAFRCAGVLLIAVHLVLAPLAWGAMTAVVRLVDDRAQEVLRADLIKNLPPDRPVILLSASDPLMSMYPFIMLKFAGNPGPASWWSLVLVAHDLRLTRVADYTLELEVLDGAILETFFEQLFRGASHPLKAGEAIDVGPLHVEILELWDGNPSKLRVQLAPEAAERAIYLIWSADGFQQISLPPVGESVVLKKHDGVYSLRFLLR